MSKILLIENYGMLNYLITEVRFDCKTIKRENRNMRSYSEYF